MGEIRIALTAEKDREQQKRRSFNSLQNPILPGGLFHPSVRLAAAA